MGDWGKLAVGNLNKINSFKDTVQFYIQDNTDLTCHSYLHINPEGVSEVVIEIDGNPVGISFHHIIEEYSEKDFYKLIDVLLTEV